jgi:hypothetical protein
MSRDRSPVVSLGIFSVATDGTMCPGVDSVSKNEYQDTVGDKEGRCVRLTTYHLHVPNVKKIRGLTLTHPHGPVQACSATASLFTPFTFLSENLGNIQSHKNGSYTRMEKYKIQIILISSLLPSFWRLVDRKSQGTQECAHQVRTV